MIKDRFTVLILLLFMMGCTSVGNENIESINENGNQGNTENAKSPINEPMNENHKYFEKELYINSEIRIVDVIGLSKEELLLKLGEDYVIKKGLPDGIEGYEYPKYGIRFVFDDFAGYFFDRDEAIVGTIFIHEGFDINGAGIGMSVSEIQDALGDGEIEDFVQGSHRFALKYVYESYFIRFLLSPDQNGCAEVATIHLRTLY